MTERDIFIAALQKEDPSQRGAYLDEACAGQPELRQQVEHLLRLYQGAGSFLEKPAAESAATGAFPAAAEPAPPPETPGTVIGPYKLLQQIGEGGMGTVFLAEQTHPVQRKVALKLIKSGMDSRQVIARFEAERQALALMDHPNIARVLDAGTTENDRPYFVMELVKGVPITKYCDEHHLTCKERLELFVPVCQAVQHAHQKGIIHRDLKPSNVMVCLYDGKPVPKVIDFGIAKATGQKLTERTMFTEIGQVVGTLEYMSPEQAELNQLDIDTRSDIYSLGVLLYELLTGTTPLERKRFQAVAFLEVLRLIREEESQKPSTRLSTTEGLPSIAANRGLEPKKLSGLVRGELDWIVMKTLEKDRNRRYETANAFAADVLRYLHDEAVQACPPSVGYRFRKFARRNKAALSVVALVVAALLMGAIGLEIDNFRVQAALGEKLQAESERADEQQKRAVAESEKAVEQGKRTAAEKKKVDALEGWRQTAYYFQIALILDAYRANNVARADEMLDKCEPDLRNWEWHYLKRLCHCDLSHTSLEAPELWKWMALSQDGQRAATLSIKGPRLPYAALLYDAATGKEIHQFTPKASWATGLAISPDGKWVALCGADIMRGTSVRLWNALTGEAAAVLKGAERWEPGRLPIKFWGFRVLPMQASIAGHMLAPAGGAMALPLQLGIDDQVARLDELHLFIHSMYGVAISPDGELVAATYRRGQLQVSVAAKRIGQ